jgi:hypothetical protein
VKVRGKVTAAIRRRVVELKGDGRSLRGIKGVLAEEGVSLSPQTISDILAAHARRRDAEDDEEATDPPSTPSRARGGAALAADATEEPEGEDSELDAERDALDALLARRPEALPRLPAEASLPARAVWWDLVQVRAEVAAARPKVRLGEYPPTQWLAMMKHATELAKNLAGLLPVPPPDATKDPANIQARAMVTGHVIQSIEAAELRAGRLCPRCSSDVEAVGR